MNEQPYRVSTGATIFLPLRTKQITTLYFLAVQVSGSPCSPQPSRTRSITSRPTGIAGSHFQCLLGNSQLLYDKDVHPLGPARTNYCFSSYTCTRPALGHGFSSALIARSLPCCLSLLEFPFNILTGERNTHHQVDSSPVFHQPAS